MQRICRRNWGEKLFRQLSCRVYKSEGKDKLASVFLKIPTVFSLPKYGAHIPLLSHPALKRRCGSETRANLVTCCF